MTLATRESLPYPRVSPEQVTSPSTELFQDTEVTHGIAEVDGGSVYYTCERPLEFITDEVPIVVSPGYMGVESSYEDFRHYLAALGKTAVTMTPHLDLPLMSTLRPEYLLRPGTLSSKATRAVLLKVQRSLDVDVADLVGHSMGGRTIKKVSLEYPKQVRSATFLASIDMEQANIVSLGSRVPSFVWHEILPDLLPDLLSPHKDRAAVARQQAIHLVPEIMRYILSSPYQTWAEGISLGCRDIQQDLEQLKIAKIKTAVLNFASDRLTSNKTTQGKLGHLVNHCETHPRRDLGHLAPYREPRVVAESVHDIIQKITST